MSNHFDYEINKELGECYLFMGELEKAETYYKKANESNPELAAPYIGLATIAVQYGQSEKALELYKEAHKVEASDKSLTGWGMMLIELNEVAAAFDKLIEALAVNPGNMIALACLVRLAYTENRVADILEQLEISMAVDEGQNCRITLAGCLITLNRIDEAIAHLETVMELDPTNPEAPDLLAHAIQK